jgi:acetylornithine deacetylase/succinyl-diaminopimelate desuccinylase-like protein
MTNQKSSFTRRIGIQGKHGAWALSAVLALCLPCLILPTANGARRTKGRPLLVEQVRQFRVSHEVDILEEYMKLLSIPDVASDHDNIEKNAQFIASMLQKRGIAAQLLRPASGSPLVYGELPARGAKLTLLFYAHYDGQPVDPASWISNPWTPVLRTGSLADAGTEIPLNAIKPPLDGNWRVYARSASDDKAAVMGLLTAVDALHSLRLSIPANVKFLFEGEEEAGSPHLPEILKAHVDLLRGNVLLLCDGPRHPSGRMQLFFGARGASNLDIRVFGPNHPLHSGIYGNWAPNPAVELTNLLANLRNDEGRILIPGFYDSVRAPDQAEQEAIKEIPNLDAELRRSYDLGRTEGNGRSLNELITLPALNLDGISAGRVNDNANNAIPAEATASIDFRLVPDQTPELVQKEVEEYLRHLGYFVVHENPDSTTRRLNPRLVELTWHAGYPPAQTSLASTFSRAVIDTVTEGVGSDVIKIPMVGGSVPIYIFQQLLGTPVIIIPIANYDNNQHASNENLRLQNLWDGIEIYASLLYSLGPRMEME